MRPRSKTEYALRHEKQPRLNYVVKLSARFGRLFMKDVCLFAWHLSVLNDIIATGCCSNGLGRHRCFEIFHDQELCCTQGQSKWKGN